MSAKSAIVTRANLGANEDELRAISDLRPTTANSISSNPSFDPATVQQDAEATRIVVHERYPQLVVDFLQHKRQHGSQVEQALYNGPDWTWQMQVARLIAKRPLVFMTSSDFTVLRNGQDIGAAKAEWDRVGTDDESQHLQLVDYLSYDEIMLGSLLGVSGPSYFINDGHRFNHGIVGTTGTYETRGIIIGLVGARFERSDRMDSAFIRHRVEKPRQHSDLDQIFRRFFSPPIPRNAQQGPASQDIQNSSSFDVDLYKNRIRITVEILLREANSRAQQVSQSAYVVIVGLGLGVWRVNDNQARYFVECFTEALEALSDELDSVGTLDFSWISVPEATQGQVRAAAANVRASATFTKRNPAAKLTGDAAGQLLVISYAWDGNAFPGNEYWIGSLSASGDPAAACMSTISELHNPILNSGFLGRIYANGVSAVDFHVEESG